VDVPGRLRRPRRVGRPAARREAREELEVDVELTGLVGVYSRPQDRVVLVVFDALALGPPRTTAEATEVRAFAAADLPWDELAFWSTELALRAALRPCR
jgi:ADP-ribose pyrophosphatase YjhB (NUDIX family)